MRSPEPLGGKGIFILRIRQKKKNVVREKFACLAFLTTPKTQWNTLKLAEEVFRGT